MPRSVALSDIVYLMEVEDACGAVTSTPVRAMFPLRLSNRTAVAVSSPIQTTFRRQPPFIVLGHKKALARSVAGRPGIQ